MRRRIALLVLALVVLGASSAFASGFNLSWQDCGEAGIGNRTFACDRNTGGSTLVASFVPVAEIDSIAAVEVRIDLQSAGATLPSWWDLVVPGGCRAGDLAMSASLPTPTAEYCVDPWGGLAIGGVAVQTAASSGGLILQNAARIFAVAAVPPENTAPLELDVETLALRLDLSHARTVDADACSGCTTPACLVLRTMRIYSPSRPAGVEIVNPARSNFVTWQSGATTSCFVPVQNRTWGAIKERYR